MSKNNKAKVFADWRITVPLLLCHVPVGGC
jgi:hypothetical protein